MHHGRTPLHLHRGSYRRLYWSSWVLMTTYGSYWRLYVSSWVLVSTSGANQASLEHLSLRHELLLLPPVFHDDRSQVRHQNFHSPSPKSTTRLPMSSEMPEGWILYVSLNDLEFGLRETHRCMLLEASQKCPVRFSRLSRIFTEDTDSGVPWTTFSE